ncbi:carbon dioxide concentrating mechanism protein [Listeria monocytogenes]|nr:carbon dioxide concentrating mechanism protein [Listeria monocytogenes]GAT40854.1 carbon dioxide concentrating mechanism protein [Listeria monocytogenes]
MECLTSSVSSVQISTSSSFKPFSFSSFLVAHKLPVTFPICMPLFLPNFL